ncbi:uncharacterized protein LOC133800402 [Humulus lupulus]|uniref:uncharacterized protein LOC133800402 n=1 Tax=Humulus lupulus TaxID=3486 RepID=UPI002B4095A7|nr:uncharacterized protein LOC133800402 [Humulus lupulus]
MIIRFEGENLPDYGNDSNMFSVCLHHGGKFVNKFGDKKYEGGRVSYFDYCVCDMINVQLERMGKSLGYKYPFGFLYKPHEKDLNFGFILYGDKSMLNFIEVLEKMRGNRIVDIYLVLPDEFIDETLVEEGLPVLEPLREKDPTIIDIDHAAPSTYEEQDIEIPFTDPTPQYNTLSEAFVDLNEDVNDIHLEHEYESERVDEEFET